MIQIHPTDNVAVALHTVAKGTVFAGVTALEEIPQGHKMALQGISANENVIKYGFSKRTFGMVYHSFHVVKQDFFRDTFKKFESIYHTIK